jgi:hypothetical protein
MPPKKAPVAWPSMLIPDMKPTPKFSSPAPHK